MFTFLSSLSECVPLSPKLQPLKVLILPDEPELDVLKALIGLWALREGGLKDSEMGEDTSNFSSLFLCFENILTIFSKAEGFFNDIFMSCWIFSYFNLISFNCSCFSLKDFCTSLRFFHSSTSFSTWAIEWTLFLKSNIISASSFCTLSSTMSKVFGICGGFIGSVSFLFNCGGSWGWWFWFKTPLGEDELAGRKKHTYVSNL